MAFTPGVTYDRSAQRLFSKRDWQRALKAAMTSAGNKFIGTRLGLRFGEYSERSLGYRAKKLMRTTERDRVRAGLHEMRRDGSYQRIVASACAPWGGWDPTERGGPPSHIWKQWIGEQLRAGRFRESRTGNWKTARTAFRKEVLEKSRIRERLKNYALDNYNASAIPLVNTGRLQRHVAENAWCDAAATATKARMIIRIPRNHWTHKVVNQTLSKLGPGEVEEINRDIGTSMQEYISGARIVGKRKKKLKLSKVQNRTIDKTIRNAHKPRAKAHKNRS